MRRRLAATTAIAVTTALALMTVSGCSKEYNDQRGKGDAPVAGKQGDDSPADVYNFLDGFGNVATKCVGKGERAYTTTKAYQEGDDDQPPEFVPAHEVVVDDPGCTG